MWMHGKTCAGRRRRVHASISKCSQSSDLLPEGMEQGACTELKNVESVSSQMRCSLHWLAPHGPASAMVMDLAHRELQRELAEVQLALQTQEALLDVVWGLDEQALPGCAASLGDLVSIR